jgi:hypothetical protein
MIVLARRAGSKQGFGLKFKRNWRRKWVAVTTFSIAEAATSRGGYGHAVITGSIVYHPRYPGCPHCRSAAFFRCSCGKVVCWDGKVRIVTCPWCNGTGELSGVLKTLDACEDV